MYFSSPQILWSFSIYLEAVAILPQLILLQRTQNIDNLTGNYVALLGCLPFPAPVSPPRRSFSYLDLLPSSCSTCAPGMQQPDALSILPSGSHLFPLPLFGLTTEPFSYDVAACAMPCPYSAAATHLACSRVRKRDSRTIIILAVRPFRTVRHPMPLGAVFLKSLSSQICGSCRALLVDPLQPQATSRLAEVERQKPEVPTLLPARTDRSKRSCSVVEEKLV